MSHNDQVASDVHHGNPGRCKVTPHNRGLVVGGLAAAKTGQLECGPVSWPLDGGIHVTLQLASIEVDQMRNPGEG